MGIAEIFTLLNAAIPGIESLYMLVKKKDGTVGVITMLDENDARFNQNIKDAEAWLAAHPKT
jgi:hypothetical protein